MAVLSDPSRALRGTNGFWQGGFFVGENHGSVFHHPIAGTLSTPVYCGRVSRAPKRYAYPNPQSAPWLDWRGVGRLFGMGRNG